MGSNLVTTDQRTFGEVFKEDFIDWICAEHFKSPVSSERSVNQYFKEFSRYSSKQLEELCELAFKEKFLPSVNWFHEQGQLLKDRDRWDQFVVTLIPPISEEQRLLNLSRIQAITKDFFRNQQW